VGKQSGSSYVGTTREDVEPCILRPQVEKSTRYSTMNTCSAGSESRPIGARNTIKQTRLAGCDFFKARQTIGGDGCKLERGSQVWARREAAKWRGMQNWMSSTKATRRESLRRGTGCT